MLFVVTVTSTFTPSGAILSMLSIGISFSSPVCPAVSFRRTYTESFVFTVIPSVG